MLSTHTDLPPCMAAQWVRRPRKTGAAPSPFSTPTAHSSHIIPILSPYYPQPAFQPRQSRSSTITHLNTAPSILPCTPTPHLPPATSQPLFWTCSPRLTVAPTTCSLTSLPLCLNLCAHPLNLLPHCPLSMSFGPLDKPWPSLTRGCFWQWCTPSELLIPLDVWCHRAAVPATYRALPHRPLLLLSQLEFQLHLLLDLLLPLPDLQGPDVGYLCACV